MPFGLDKAQWDSILSGIARSQYNLLLGAGASVSALDRHGRKLPNAYELAERLVQDFKIPSDTREISLPRAYEWAERFSNKDGRPALNEYLSDLFTQCQVPNWYEYLCSIPWSRIWTLNIDDVVEQAYSKWISKRAQNPISVSWSDAFQEPNHVNNEVIVVHLHGRSKPVVTKAPGSADLVFSIVEYLNASGLRHAWHHIFSNEFSTQPFIIIGARLADEFDLAEILRRGNRSQEIQGLPSLVVLREISELMRQEFEYWGLVPIQADADSFISSLFSDVTPFLEASITTAAGVTINRTHELARFLQQYEWLEINERVEINSRHDLYAGYEPIWADILSEKDAEFGIVNHVIELIMKQEKGQHVYCLWGGAFSGKSTAMLRIARKLRVKGYDIFNFRGEEKLDVEAAVWWIRKSPKTVILIDGLADPAPEVGELAEKCEQSKLPLILVGAERTSRLKRLYSAIPAQFLNLSSDLRMGHLSNSDVAAILDKLTSARRLGSITSYTRKQQQRYFIETCKRDLFTALADLEGGLGFRQRLRIDYEHIERGDLRNAYVVCCMAYSLGYALPLSILSATADVSVTDLVSSLSTGGELTDVLERRNKVVKPRNRRAASLVIQQVVGKDSVFHLSIAFAKQLAPYVTWETIRQRTIPYRIARELMDDEIVASWVGRERVIGWYEELANEYGWNARYWEQRALAEAKRAQYDKAESYAEYAVQLHPDPLSYNTLGTILLRKAVDWFELGTEDAFEYYWRGVRALSDSRKSSDIEYEHPYVTFFEYTLRFVDRHCSGVPSDDRLRHEWNSWWQSARHASPFAHTELYDQLQHFQQEWLLRGIRQDATQDRQPSA